MSAKKEVLEVNQATKERVHALAKNSGTTAKDTTAAILGWAIPHFEDGRCILTQPRVEVKTASDN